MWREILAIGASVIATAIFVLVVGAALRAVDLGIKWLSSVWYMSGAAFVMLAATATLDGEPWLIPAALFVFVFLVVSNLIANTKRRAEVQRSSSPENDWLLAVSRASERAIERTMAATGPYKPRVVDYSQFVLRLIPRNLIHRPNDANCVVAWFPGQTVTMADLIRVADEHSCSIPNVSTEMKAVA